MMLVGTDIYSPCYTDRDMGSEIRDPRHADRYIYIYVGIVCVFLCAGETIKERESGISMPGYRDEAPYVGRRSALLSHPV